MKYIIAIHQDDCDYSDDGQDVNFSACWIKEFERQGHSVRLVNAWSRDILAQLKGCHAFMWRWRHTRKHMQVARRLLPLVERYLGLPVFPDEQTAWHYDDKCAQAMLFDVLDIPHPETYLFFDQEEALAWSARHGEYPVVMKLATGASSINVKRIQGAEEAARWIRLLFIRGVHDLRPRTSWKLRCKEAARMARQKLKYGYNSLSLDVHKGYVLFQKFLPDNAFDTRVNVTGDTAFAYRRMNRPGDFRASGSGLFDLDPSNVDTRFIRLAFETAGKLRMQSCSIDGLYDNGTPVLVEVSYTYGQKFAHTCPGYWELAGSPQTGDLIWREGRIWPGEAQAAVFLKQLDSIYLQ